jgi:hypothetical protein
MLDSFARLSSRHRYVAFQHDALLGIPTAARLDRQNSPHDPVNRREEVHSVFAANTASSNQLEVGLIGKPSRLRV